MAEQRGEEGESPSMQQLRDEMSYWMSRRRSSLEGASADGGAPDTPGQGRVAQAASMFARKSQVEWLAREVANVGPDTPEGPDSRQPTPH